MTMMMIMMMMTMMMENKLKMKQQISPEWESDQGSIQRWEWFIRRSTWNTNDMILWLRLAQNAYSSPLSNKLLTFKSFHTFLLLFTFCTSASLPFYMYVHILIQHALVTGFLWKKGFSKVKKVDELLSTPFMWLCHSYPKTWELLSCLVICSSFWSFVCLPIERSVVYSWTTAISNVIRNFYFQ